MSKRTVIVLAYLVVFALLLAGRVLAMSSANYKLEWFTPLTGGGGGPAQSTNYAVNFTVGQSAIGAGLTSTNYRACLGYWCGAGGEYRVYLPLVLRNV
ncbi:MAG: hypothetical protein N2508_08190 [Anaerolineae bacterium]|nr:hypothetical protein [Anaerolineae bacterium]